jgi:hypothetical protein
MVLGAVSASGARVAIIGTRDYGDPVDDGVRSWLIIALIASAARPGLRVPEPHHGVAGARAGGWSARSPAWSPWRAEDWGLTHPVVADMATSGFAVIAVVGVLRWRQSPGRPHLRTSRPARPGPTHS